MNNTSQQYVLKIETKSEKYEIVFEQGVFMAIKNGKVVFSHDDYEVVRYYLLGW